MKCNVKIDSKLYKIYSDIRLGLLQFKADVKKSDNSFWEYMNNTVQPQIKMKLMGKNGMIFLVLEEVEQRIRLSEEIREGIEFRQRHFYEEFVVAMIYIVSIPWLM